MKILWQKFYRWRLPVECRFVYYKSFKRKEDVKLHRSIVHADKRKFLCLECPQTFKSKRHMLKHKNVHKGTDVLRSCKLCSTTVSSTSLQRSHKQEIHQGVNNFDYNKCEHSFRRMEYLLTCSSDKIAKQ